jgi:hypothetical protein
MVYNMKYENNKIVYEVGDWVVKNIDFNYFPADYGAYKVAARIDFGRFRLEKDLNYSFFDNNFRPATQEEIDKATKEEEIKVGEHKAKIMDGASIIMVGCQEVSKELFLKIGKKAGWL